MDRLKVVKKSVQTLPQRMSEYEYIEDEILTYFPQSKYFQIHFQHSHENADVIQQELLALKKHVVSVEQKLEKIMSLLDEKSSKN